MLNLILKDLFKEVGTLRREGREVEGAFPVCVVLPFIYISFSFRAITLILDLDHSELFLFNVQLFVY